MANSERLTANRGVHVGRIFKYLLFAAYHGKFTVCLQLKVNTIRFTVVNLLFDLLQVLQSSNGGKKVGNTAVNGKLLLAVGNPTHYRVVEWASC